MLLHFLMMMKMMWTMMTKKRKYAVVLHFMMKMMLTKKENRPRGGRGPLVATRQDLSAYLHLKGEPHRWSR